MASIVDTSVKHAYSSMTGASVINGTAGSLNAALKAFLVTGWGTKAVDSAAISNGVCRLTFASGKSAAEIHAVIALSGASPAALNGEQRVTAVASGWVEFKTDLPDGPVTGSLSFKMPSLGWEEVYSKTNVSVFRSADPRGTRPYFRIDDSNALYARVQMYESMTDVDTGLGVAPGVAGGYYWAKCSSAQTKGMYWLLIGDSRGFYLGNAPYEYTDALSQNAYPVNIKYAGDLNSVKSGDAWAGFLSGAISSDWPDTSGDVFATTNANGMSLQRASHGLGSAIVCDKGTWGVSGMSGVAGGMGVFPARADNSLRLGAFTIFDGTRESGPRGELPGALHCPQTGLIAAIGQGVRFREGNGDYAGKTLLTVWGGRPDYNYGQGVAFFDVRTPWRTE